jgi:hypothetical protein
MHTGTRRSPLVNVIEVGALILVLFPAGHILSYPVALSNSIGPVAHMPGYQSVEWLVDNTIFRRPIVWWSEVCGSREKLRESRRLRVDEFFEGSIEKRPHKSSPSGGRLPYIPLHAPPIHQPPQFTRGIVVLQRWRQPVRFPSSRSAICASWTTTCCRPSAVL